MDLGAYSIKHAVLKYSKEADEMVQVSGEVYTVPAAWSGVDMYFEGLGQFLQDMAPNLDKKLPIRFSASSMIAPTNLSYLSRVDKPLVKDKIKEEMEKFATQEKLPPESPHNRFFDLFIKEQEDKAQVISSSTLLNPKYIAILKKHLYVHGLKFGGIYPIMYSQLEFYRKLLERDEALKEEPVCFVDIGHLTTKVNLFFQEKLLFNKILHFGTKNFHDELFDFCAKAGESSMNNADVETMLRKVGFTANTELANDLGLDINDPAPYLKNINDTLRSIFQKVQSSYSYFGTALARNFTVDNQAFVTVRKGPTHMFVSGGVVNAPGFAGKANEAFGNSMKVHLMHPYDIKGTMERKPEDMTREETLLALREQNPYTDAMMTAMLALDSTKNHYNLVAQVDSENENLIKVLMKLPMIKYRNLLIAVLVLVILKIGWSYISIKWELDGYNAKVRTLQAQVDGASSLRADYRKLLEEKVYGESRFQYIKGHLKNYPHWPSVLKKLMQKVGPEIKLNFLEFTSTVPSFDGNAFRRWKDNPDGNPLPWSGRGISFKMDGLALTRQAVPKLIQDLKETGIFDVPKPPATKFIPEQVKTSFDRTRNQEITETVAAHYEFALEGLVILENTL